MSKKRKSTQRSVTLRIKVKVNTCCMPKRLEMNMSSTLSFLPSFKIPLKETSLAKDFFHPNTLMHLPLKTLEKEKKSSCVIEQKIFLLSFSSFFFGKETTLCIKKFYLMIINVSLSIENKRFLQPCLLLRLFNISPHAREKKNFQSFLSRKRRGMLPNRIETLPSTGSAKRRNINNINLIRFPSFPLPPQASFSSYSFLFRSLPRIIILHTCITHR